MVSRHVGVDNWPGRWESKRAELDRGVDWSEFRQSHVLMKGIQTGPTHASRFLKWCEKIGCPPAVYADSPFGNPTAKDYKGVLTSASSLRAGYYAWRIRTLWAKDDPNGMFMPRHLLEIGGGYGALVRAIALSADLPLVGVALADAGPLQIIQKMFLANAVTGGLDVDTPAPGDRYDLVTNTNSLGEMHSSEVARYLDIIQSRLEPGGVFYTVNRRDRVTNFAAYPYDGKWRHTLELFLGDKHWVECYSVRDLDADSAHPATLL